MNEMDCTEEVLRIAVVAEVIFYFVCPENRILKREMENKIAFECAEKLGFKQYAMRSGPSVQNPKLLLDELSHLDVDTFDIVYISKTDEECSLLSHFEKMQFVKYLGSKSENTGIIAKLVMDESDQIIK